jgi:hypothetical protein
MSEESTNGSAESQSSKITVDKWGKLSCHFHRYIQRPIGIPCLPLQYLIHVCDLTLPILVSIRISVVFRPNDEHFVRHERHTYKFESYDRWRFIDILLTAYSISNQFSYNISGQLGYLTPAQQEALDEFMKEAREDHINIAKYTVESVEQVRFSAISYIS